VSPAELQTDFSAEQWNLKSTGKRLKAVGNLWEGFWSKRQTLSEALELLDRNFLARK
jgi:DNA primase